MKLENKLIKSFNRLQDMMGHRNNGKYTIREFYREYHHYERLNARYKKVKGIEFNPIQYIESRRTQESYVLDVFDVGYGQLMKGGSTK